MSAIPTPSGAVPGESELRELVAGLLDLDPTTLEPDGNLVVLGLSSLEIMRLVGTWRRAGLPVDFDRLVAAPTLTGWSAHLAELSGPVTR
ncbi:phosphopantetheine-binding protein [Frankia sp. AgPm24]|uniref:phosphopantetheine-binding protein n=1 Tax=Frankia sp. AgPm24 TaxID=631128 RepID=UPI00200DA9CF|nr:phosphopantetheine-binding protein [Frankia sp. AgPm24]MCK9921038.1 phosphopantetheine-binding protein [Frankia sp. AgPm24]